jgi:cytidine diphosphoramidate kinase
MIVWVMGLSGAGKTTFARLLYEAAKPHRPQLVHLDGDRVRAVMGNDLGYSYPERKLSAERMSRLCLELDSQGLDVICSTMSLFRDRHQWNRENFSAYYEIYLDTPIETLRERDGKGIYAAAAEGTIGDVVGVDIPYEEPESPEFRFCNDGAIKLLENASNEVLNSLGWGRKSSQA